MTPDRPITALFAAILDDPADVRPIHDPALWRRIREEAPRYGVSAAVAHRAAPLLDGEDREWCEGVLKTAWVKHRSHLHRTLELLSILERNGIPAVPLKGSVLAERYYDPPHTRRPSIDIDILVPFHQRRPAVDLLSKGGYTPVRLPWWDEAHTHHLTLTHPERPRIEVHFHLHHGYRNRHLSSDDFLPGADFVEAAGAAVRAFDPASELFYLANHWVSHYCADFAPLLDLRLARRRVDDSSMAVVASLAVRHKRVVNMLAANDGYRARWGRPLIPEAAWPPEACRDRRIDGLHSRLVRAARFSLPWSLQQKLEILRLNFLLSDDWYDASYGAFRAAAHVFRSAARGLGLAPASYSIQPPPTTKFPS